MYWNLPEYVCKVIVDLWHRHRKGFVLICVVFLWLFLTSRCTYKQRHKRVSCSWYFWSHSQPFLIQESQGKMVFHFMTPLNYLHIFEKVRADIMLSSPPLSRCSSSSSTCDMRWPNWASVFLKTTGAVCAVCVGAVTCWDAICSLDMAGLGLACLWSASRLVGGWTNSSLGILREAHEQNSPKETDWR